MVLAKLFMIPISLILSSQAPQQRSGTSGPPGAVGLPTPTSPSQPCPWRCLVSLPALQGSRQRAQGTTHLAAGRDVLSLLPGHALQGIHWLFLTGVLEPWAICREAEHGSMVMRRKGGLEPLEPPILGAISSGLFLQFISGDQILLRAGMGKPKPPPNPCCGRLQIYVRAFRKLRKEPKTNEKPPSRVFSAAKLHCGCLCADPKVPISSTAGLLTCFCDFTVLLTAVKARYLFLNSNNRKQIVLAQIQKVGASTQWTWFSRSFLGLH